jgi:hypothetical protein
MRKVKIQHAIAEYHAEMLEHGMDMHNFHATWHEQNPGPGHPPKPDIDWGRENEFGYKFLQMHHEMVKATDAEPKFFMKHQSVVSWFAAKSYDLPAEWDPLTPIPQELAFHTSIPRLRRRTEDPKFSLPAYFTIQGILSGQDPEPITRAEKMADFVNINQLGCCILFPHNIWHTRIGGAMMELNLAIDDPVFYFGVHWHIDKVFDTYKLLQQQKLVSPKKRNVPVAFTTEELLQLKTLEELGIKIRSEN